MNFSKKDFIYPDLSYKIIGCAYKVHNDLGGGFLEAIYQKAMSLVLKEKCLLFQEQKQIPFEYLNSNISKYRPDFIVEEKVVVDLKRTKRLLTEDFEQTLNYLKLKSLKLGLLIHFGREYVSVKRVVNL